MCVFCGLKDPAAETAVRDYISSIRAVKLFRENADERKDDAQYDVGQSCFRGFGRRRSIPQL